LTALFLWKFFKIHRGSPVNVFLRIMFEDMLV